jgi:hypothetical protein
VRYSVDTSAILDGWRRYYPPDVFPGIWDGLDDLIADGSLRATEEVLVELERKDDEVHAWMRRRERFFIAIDDRIQDVVSDILSTHARLLDTRSGRSAGDPFVIALAEIEHCTVVTGERATNSADRPNIPDVCAARGVRCISLLQLLRDEGWKFAR